MMTRPCLLPCFLLLPLGTCFPVLHPEEPMDTTGGIRDRLGWAGLARGHRVHFPWGSSPWPRAPHPPALLVVARELRVSGRERASFRLRFGRQEEDSGATGFLLAHGEKASSPLGTLAEELTGYSRKKGGFRFRFGRR